MSGKKPAIVDWAKYGRRCASPQKLAQWEAKFPAASIGIVCGRVIALDLDIMDGELVALLAEIAGRVFGAQTWLHRIGRAPRRVLVYRAAEGIRSTTMEGAAGKVEVLASGKQFVAFGIHPDTRRPYEWVSTSRPIRRLCRSTRAQRRLSPQERGGRGRRLKRKNNPMHTLSTMHTSPRCCAKTRRGKPCQCPAVRGRSRCRMHGGADGSGAPIGNRNALKHGRYTAAALAERRVMRDLIRQCRAMAVKL